MSSSGVGKVVAGVVGLALVGSMVAAYRYSQTRGAGSDAEREARLELVRFSGALARAGLQNGLPETSQRVPRRLADVSGKKYTSVADDWLDEGFARAQFQAMSPQSVQYRWLKLSPQDGRVEGRADTDADGKPDTWFEIDVHCPKSNQCQAANFVTEVTADGVRQPPSLLSWFGRASTFVGDPPSREAEDTEAPPPPPSSASTANAPVPKPLAVVEPGVPVGLDTLYLEAERRAGTKLSGAALLTLEYKSVRGPLGNTADGLTLHGLYGRQDVKGWVHRGEQLVSVTFNQQGWVEVLQKAPGELHGLAFAECQPEKLLTAIAASTEKSLDLSLGWDVKRERGLWSAKEAKGPRRIFGADRCAIVK
jgi:hypothetical protein